MKTAEDYARMREAKKRKREALGPVLTVEVGQVTFEGTAFGGSHVVRLTCREDAREAVFVEVDGVLTCVKTERGARALLMRRIGSATGKCGTPGTSPGGTREGTGTPGTSPGGTRGREPGGRR